jgi:hypothetical protein
MSKHEVPEIIRAAGAAAVDAYGAFCADPGLAPGTRKIYTVRARRFLR